MSNYSYNEIKNMTSELLPVCAVTYIHENLVRKAESTLISAPTSSSMADTFSVISDATRIRMLSALFDSEMCVCDLAKVLNMSQSAISHQLRLLRDHRLVKARKCGRIVYYSLDDCHIRQLIDIAKEHIEHGSDQND